MEMVKAKAGVEIAPIPNRGLRQGGSGIAYCAIPRCRSVRYSWVHPTFVWAHASLGFIPALP
jgi:hypothetical protein